MEGYLKRFGAWNDRKTLCRTTLYSLPAELVFPALSRDEADEELSYQPPLHTKTVPTIAKGLTCRTCQCVFPSLEKQHIHFKSDLHVYNMRLSLRSKPSLTANQFSQFQQQVVDDSSSEDDDEDDDDEHDDDGDKGDDDSCNFWATEKSDGEEARHVIKIPDVCREFPLTENRFGTVQVNPYDPKQGVTLTFTPNESGWSFTINELALVALSSRDSTAHSADVYWNRLQATLRKSTPQTMWCVLLVRSGKFAGFIMDIITGQVLAHKVFRRYTVRAKAGGSQSSYDNKGMKAQSAGASMRRAGERHLREDIGSLMQIWDQQLELCSLILVSIPKTMRSYLFRPSDNSTIGEGLLDSKNDTRIKNIPFMTSKVTFEECQTVLWKCSSAWFSRSPDLHLGSKMAQTKDCKNSSKFNIIGTEAAYEQGKPTGLFRDLDESLAELAMQRQTLRAEKQRRRSARKCKEIAKPMSGEKLLEYSLEKRWFEVLAGWFRTGREREVVILLQNLRWREFRLILTESEDDDLEIKGPLEIGISEGDARLGLCSLESQIPQPFSEATLELSTNLETNILFSLIEVVEGRENLSATLLHIAAETGSSTAVFQLLLGGSLPGALDGRGRTSYFLCKDKETRDAFRRARGILEQYPKDKDYWDSAGVGPPLYPEKEAEANAAQKLKDKEKRKRAKDRKRESERLAKEEALEKLSVQQKQATQLAEEAQLRRKALGNCSSTLCCRSLGEKGVIIIEVFGGKVCSAACALNYRREIQARAAESRLS